MSEALSSFLIWPPVQSRHSTMKSSPGLTVATGGMSGCQRLWIGVVCSRGPLPISTEMIVWGIASSSSLDLQMRADELVRELGDVGLGGDAAGVEDREALGGVANGIGGLRDQEDGAVPRF